MADYTYTPPETSAIIGLVDTYIRWKEASGPDRGYEIYHPSAFGKCLRMMQYQRYEARKLLKGDKEQFSSKMLRLFANGHAMHERWKDYFEAMGVLRGVWTCRNPICRAFNDSGKQIEGVNFQALYEGKLKPRSHGESELQGIFKPEKCNCGCRDFRYDEVLVEDKELNFKGHADIILDFSKFDPKMFSEAEKEGFSVMFDPKHLPKGIVVIDMKTVGSNAYKSQVLKSGAHKYYQIQLTIYVNVLKCDYGLIIYEEKDQFDLASFRVDQNKAWWEKIRQQALLMQDMASKPKPLLPPPRPISKSSYECKSCPFSKFCHKSGGIWDSPDLEAKRTEFYGELL